VTPQISVVIPAYNAADTLPDCLRALSRQVNVPAPFEVLVIDDGSNDGTPDVVREFLASQPLNAGLHGVVRLLQQPHTGAAAARNRGIQAARGELILFTDADCVPADDWLAAMARPFQQPGVIGCKGVYATRQRELIARFAQAEYEVKYQALSRRDAIDLVDTYSAGYRRAALLAAGGFDPSFPGASVEDVELAFRLSKQGHRLIFNPAAVVWHRHPPTLAGYLGRKARYGFWRTRVYLRHPAKMGGDTYTPRALWWQLPLACGWPLAAAVGWMWSPANWISLALLVLFWLTCLPFVRHALKQAEPDLALLAPALLWLRSLALVGGLLTGVIHIGYRQIISGTTAPRTVNEQRL
jgi:glycosyltransferase involved in cell wall biosynthesis